MAIYFNCGTSSSRLRKIWQNSRDAIRNTGVMAIKNVLFLITRFTAKQYMVTPAAYSRI